MKTKQLRSWLAFIIGAVVLGFLIGFGVKTFISDVQAQSEKKTVKLARTNRPQLKFSDLKVGQQARKFGESFDAESDWVKNLSFKLENISGKRIIFLQVNVNFPETRSTGYMMSYPVIFGETPSKKIKGKPMIIESGDILEVSLDKEKDRIYTFVNERQSIELIQKVELEIGFVIFEDKTAWSAGSLKRQDPDNPDRYNHIENEPQQ